MSTQHHPASKRRKLLLLVVLLGIVPIGFLVLRTAKHQFGSLPYIGERDVIAPGDTAYWTVPPFSFIDQNGSTVTEKTVAGKVIVADFFFTRCTGICPRMTAQMQQLQFKLNKAGFEKVIFLSHTVDPEHDTPEVLYQYARKWEADSTRWRFLTGDASKIYRQGNRGYLLSAGDTGHDEDFLHSPEFVLVDTDRHIRGMYDGTRTSSVDSLVSDLKLLLKEERLKEKQALKAAGK